MSGLLSLLRKEWRDARTLLIVGAALVPVVLFLADLVARDAGKSSQATAWTAAGLIGLFGMVIAAEVIAADNSAGRLSTLALLPTPLAAVGAAKLCYLALVTTLFAAWTIGCALLLQLLFQTPEMALHFVDRLPATLMLVGATTLPIVSVLFASALSQRGFTALCGGCVLLASVVSVLLTVRWEALEFVPASGHKVAAGLVLAATLLVGTAISFIRGPVHAGSLLRRAVLAFSVPALVLIPAGFATAGVLRERVKVSPEDPRVRVLPQRFSPDGEHLLVYAWRTDNPHAIHRVWSIELATREIVEFPVKGLELDFGFEWTADGVRMLEGTHASDRAYEFDLSTGEIVRTRSVEQLEADGSDPLGRVPVIHQRTEIGMREIADRRVNLLLRVSDVLELVTGNPCHERALLRNRLTGAVEVVNFRESRSTEVVPAGHGSVHLSPGGLYGVVRRPERTTIVDLQNERIAYEAREGETVAHPGGGSDHHVVAVSPQGTTELIDLRTGERSGFAPDLDFENPWQCVRTHDDGSFVVAQSGGRLVLHSADSPAGALIHVAQGAE